MNSICLIGNLTKEPELKYTTTGRATTAFSIAVTQYKNDDGEWVSDFFECVAWGKLAENMAESLGKGTRVMLFGKIYVDKWKDAEGLKRKKNKIRVDYLGPELNYAKCVVERNPKQADEGPIKEYKDEDAN